MTMSRTTVAAGLIAASLLFPATASQAAIILQSSAFSFSNLPAVSKTLSFDAFDPNLGMLDEVEVYIQGSFGFQVRLEAGETAAPQVVFDVGRLGERGFAFSGDGARFQFPVVRNINRPFMLEPAQAVFSFSFAFDATADLIGGAVPTMSSIGATLIPPPLVIGERADFLKGVVPLDIFQFLSFRPSGFQPFPGLSGSGVVLLTYRYTAAPPPTEVPEPGALLLLAAGLAGLAGSRHGRPRRRA